MPSRRYGQLGTFCFLLFLTRITIAQTAPPENSSESITADIRSLLVFMQRTDAKRAGLPETTRRFFELFSPLWIASEREPVEFVKSLLKFQATATEETAHILSHRLWQLTDISPAHLTEGAMSEIDNPDPRFQKVVDRILTRVEARPGGSPDFGNYFPIVPPQNNAHGIKEQLLIKRMYALAPGDAFLGMMLLDDRSDERRLRWAEKIVSDGLWKRQHGYLKSGEADDAAVEQLKFLAGRPEWWARLYVAAIYRKEPALRDAETLKQLQDDKHLLIREMATKVDELAPR